MRKIYLFIFTTAILFYAACKKNSDDLAGNYYIAGRAFWYNNFSTNGTYSPLTGRNVQIKYADDLSNNYLFSAKTDSSGYFLFPNLSKKEYKISFRDSLNSVSYSGDTSLSVAGNVEGIVLVASPDTAQQNGFIYKVTDKNGNIISNCTVCVFSSPLLVRTDSCIGSVFQLTTNSFGLASKFNVAAGDYYTAFWIDNNQVRLTAADTLVIDDFGIVGPRTVKVVQ